MVRSQEALAKRAAKRGISVNEMKIKDSGLLTKKQKDFQVKKLKEKGDNVDEMKILFEDNNDINLTNKEIQEKKEKNNNTATKEVKLPGNWICTQCNNVNFPDKKDCNRCGKVPENINKDNTKEKIIKIKVIKKDLRKDINKTNKIINEKDMNNEEKEKQKQKRIAYIKKIKESIENIKNENSINSSSRINSNKDINDKKNKDIKASSNWTCIKCNNINFPNRQDCNRCGMYIATSI